jgi:hypothetical protein
VSRSSGAAEIRGCTDHRQQLRLMSHFSRTIFQRTAQIHRILPTAAASDQRGWTPERYETWLSDDLTRLLL